MPGVAAAACCVSFPKIDLALGGTAMSTNRSTEARKLANAVRFWGEVNPDFLKGTAVEKAAETLARSAGAPAAR